MDTYNISKGMDVLGSDGGKVGQIDEVNPDHFVVKKGSFFPKDYYIPTSAIANVEGESVSLNVTKDAAMSQDPSWEQQPVATGGASASAGMRDDREPFEHEQDSSKTLVNEDDHLRIDVAEEELTATKRQVDRGDVNIHKTVVAEEQQIDVPVTEERVNVQRRTVDREVDPGSDAFTEGTIEVPVHGEEVDVQKRTRVSEEIDIDKDAVQRTERVSDTVRHEEVTVDGDVTEGSKGNASKSGRGNKRKRR